MGNTGNWVQGFEEGFYHYICEQRQKKMLHNGNRRYCPLNNRCQLLFVLFILEQRGT